MLRNSIDWFCRYQCNFYILHLRVDCYFCCCCGFPCCSCPAFYCKVVCLHPDSLLHTHTASILRHSACLPFILLFLCHSFSSLPNNSSISLSLCLVYILRLVPYTFRKSLNLIHVSTIFTFPYMYVDGLVHLSASLILSLPSAFSRSLDYFSTFFTCLIPLIL